MAKTKWVLSIGVAIMLLGPLLIPVIPGCTWIYEDWISLGDYYVHYTELGLCLHIALIIIGLVLAYIGASTIEKEKKGKR